AMHVDSASEGSTVIVHGGEKNSRSTSSRVEGAMWKLTSVASGSSSSLGTTSVGSIARSPQYSRLTSTSIGALHMLSTFLAANRRGLSVTSARRPSMKVMVASVRPM